MSWLSKTINNLTGKTGRDQARRDIVQGIQQGTGSIKGGYQAARGYLTDARNNVTGRINTGYAGALNMARAGYQGAIDRVGSGYRQAGDTARLGYQQARSDIGSLYGTARGDISGGYRAAMDRLNTGYDTGVSNLKEGYGKAQGYYDSPEMTRVRQELSNRIAGQGGFSPEVLEKMKAGTREEFGSGLRGVEQSLGSYYGDSGASGLAGENLARAGTELAGRRASAVRDIDIQNAMLAEDEKTQAMQSMREEAYQRAGLSADEARNLATMETGRGQQLADLESRMGSGLAALASEEGAALAGLSTDEAGFLANLKTQEGTTIGDLMRQQGLTDADLTKEQAQFLANIDANYGANMSNLSTEEATMLAQIFVSGGSAKAGTRDTAGIMPLLSGFAQGAGSAAGTAAGAAIFSSLKTKENITPMTQEDHERNLRTISNMAMVRYRYKEEYRPSEDNGKLHTGLIAEDAPEEMATTGRDKLHIGDMIGVALSAIKALTDRVEALEGKQNA